MTRKIKAMHTRIVIGGVILLLGLAAFLYETSFFAVR